MLACSRLLSGVLGLLDALQLQLGAGSCDGLTQLRIVLSQTSLAAQGLQRAALGVRVQDPLAAGRPPVSADVFGLDQLDGAEFEVLVTTALLVAGLSAARAAL